eukprot:5110960-Amphidinium_carterae.8
MPRRCSATFLHKSRGPVAAKHNEYTMLGGHFSLSLQVECCDAEYPEFQKLKFTLQSGQSITSVATLGQPSNVDNSRTRELSQAISETLPSKTYC